MAQKQPDLSRSNLGAQAAATFGNVVKAGGDVGGVFKKTLVGTGGKVAGGLDATAQAAGRAARNTASVLLSATDGAATLASKYKQTAAIVTVIAAVGGAFTWLRGRKKEQAARAAEVDDLQQRLAALKAARSEMSAVAGSTNDRVTGGHAAATGRGRGVEQSA